MGGLAWRPGRAMLTPPPSVDVSRLPLQSRKRAGESLVHVPSPASSFPLC